jgi:hypothetical protein
MAWSFNQMVNVSNQFMLDLLKSQRDREPQEDAELDSRG